MHNVLYKADKHAATDEDCSKAEADDDGQGQSATRHGCGGTPHHTTQYKHQADMTCRGAMEDFQNEEEQLTG